VFLANVGEGGDAAFFLSHLRTIWNVPTEKSVLIWMVPVALLEDTEKLERFLPALATFMKETQETLLQILSFPELLERHHSALRRLKALGVRIYQADQNASFIEVHRPDGIMVAVPGRPFES
jgi:hypothetical protein